MSSTSLHLIRLALRIILSMPSCNDSFSNVNTLHRERSAELMRKLGFSVVAPIRVMVPFSTKGKKISCCDLVNRWLRKRGEFLVSFFLEIRFPLPAIIDKNPVAWLLHFVQENNRPLPRQLKKALGILECFSKMFCADIRIEIKTSLRILSYTIVPYLTSATPWVVAPISLKCALVVLAIILARVVFPTPQGPQRIIDLKQVKL